MINSKISVQAMERMVNALMIFALVVLLFMAFILQYVFNELPCPLCLLQRVGFIITGIGFMLNLRFGLRPSHYAITLLGALFTSFVALRQVALHILPGTGAYGSSLFGFHLYTWSFIISIGIVVFTAIILGLDIQYIESKKKPAVFTPILHVLFALLFILTLGNFVSTLIECGIGQCPDNPLHYLL